MSMVKSRFWKPVEELSFLQKRHREHSIRQVLLAIASTIDGEASRRIFSAMIQNGKPLSQEEVDCIRLKRAEELPGKFVVISESWQGEDRNDYFLKALYVDAPGPERCCALVFIQNELNEKSALGHGCLELKWVSFDELMAIGTFLKEEG